RLEKSKWAILTAVIFTPLFMWLVLGKELVREVESFASQEMEASWPLPLEKWHQQNCPSPYADTANSRAQKGGCY
ncbi:hypothetical protein V6260_18885, partial [Pseudoalteromonas aliena]